jgi:hypothetical protein
MDSSISYDGLVILQFIIGMLQHGFWLIFIIRLCWYFYSYYYYYYYYRVLLFLKFSLENRLTFSPGYCWRFRTIKIDHKLPYFQFNFLP